MTGQESSAAGPPSPGPHPLPVHCWMWPVGGLFLGMTSATILHFCIDPPAIALERFPRDHPRWTELMIIGGAGVAIGLAYGWFWHRFARRQSLTRITWHTGTGLILTGAAFLILTGWLIAGIIYLAGLVFWAQNSTRKHFDWS